MDELDQLNFGITRARSLGFTELTTNLILRLPKAVREKVIESLKARGHRVKYKGPMSFNFPHHLIKLRKTK